MEERFESRALINLSKSDSTKDLKVAKACCAWQISWSFDKYKDKAKKYTQYIEFANRNMSTTR